MARPVHPRKPRASSQARIQQILTAARELLSEQGAAQLSIYDVAERAGIPPSSIYHFFPSVPALLEGLTSDIHSAFRACLQAPIEHASLSSWHDLARQLEQRTLAIYASDAAARQLILVQHGLNEVTLADQQHDARLGKLLEQVFSRHFALPPLPDDLHIFALAMELSDRVYARSIQLHAHITERFAEEALRVFIAYLGLYLPPALPARPQPLAIDTD